MPTIDFPTIDLNKIKLPFELPFDLPKIDLPTVEVPAFDFSKLELPKLDLSKLNIDDVPSPEQVIEWFRDAVFAGTELVALTAERVAEVQKQFVELVKTQVKRVQG